MREALKKARLAKGLSIEEIAEKIGVTPSVFYKWEDGTRDPLMKNARKVAEILETNVEELFFNNKLDKTSSEVA
ncbi:MAG: XRE family transcriptional regulator [Clostridiaceae bacterium BRH_c20a]|nr:MAG: XRE family transcriptional regulator [Clostridiaceae bacterium BRH_c20a]